MARVARVARVAKVATGAPDAKAVRTTKPLLLVALWLPARMARRTPPSSATAAVSTATPRRSGGVVQCPYWVVDADGSEYHDPNHKPPDSAAGAPVAPRAAVDKIEAADAPTAAAIDMNAMFEAFALAEDPDDPTIASMKQVYLKAASRSAAMTKAVLPVCILGVLGTAPSGQNFRAKFGANGALGSVEVVDDDSGPLTR